MRSDKAGLQPGGLPQARPNIIDSPVGAEIVLEGRRYINFAGSSYLGLSGRSEILEEGVAALRKLGAGYQISIRCGIFADHTIEHLDALVDALRRLL